MTEAPLPLSTSVGEEDYAKVEPIKATSSISSEQVDQMFNLEELASRLAKTHYTRIAMQFPDDQLQYSGYIYSRLSQLVQDDNNNNIQERKFFVLADTSYGSCCVDQVAARHIDADALIHFGDACLSPVDKSLGVYYVFGTLPLNLDNAVKNIISEIPSQKILLVASAQYDCHLPRIYELLKETFPNKEIIPAVMSLPIEYTNATVIGSSVGSKFDDEILSSKSDSLIPRRRHLSIKGDLSEYSLVHIGEIASSVLLHLSTIVSSVQVYNGETETFSQPRVNLQRRYKAMLSAKSASTIGILINTLSLAHCNDAVSHVKERIKGAGKKSYTFVVGKPNVAKLANFDVVDVWVVLGCSQSGMSFVVDGDSSNEYYKPIVTPFELELALDPHLNWPGTWLNDFVEALSLGNDTSSQTTTTTDEDIDPDAPTFDAVSGKLVYAQPLFHHKRLEHIELDHNDDDDDSTYVKDLATRMTSNLTIKDTFSTAADFLQNKRTYKGLGCDLNDDDDDDGDRNVVGAKLEIGRSGIARDYADGQ